MKPEIKNRQQQAKLFGAHLGRIGTRMASLSVFLAMLAAIFAAAGVLQVRANCDVKTFNSTECRDIHYDSSEDFLYVTCRGRDGSWFLDRYHLHVLLQYVGDGLQCGDAKHNFAAVCHLSTLIVQGTSIVLTCDGKLTSIDLSDCLGVDSDTEVLFSCDYDSYYE